MVTIRKINESEWPEVWKIVEPVFRAGDSYPYSPDIDRDQALQVWVTNPIATFIAVDEESEAILGTYYLKPNQPALGAHVCNCGYIVAEDARGRGVASAMCEHSQQEAVRQGFRAMQYNLVVATNEPAIRLWQKLGFEIVGTLTEAFNHSTYGLVDAHVMYKVLLSAE